MRMLSGDVNVYYEHDTLTPSNVRGASYGNERSSGTLIPEVGDLIYDFPGYMGEPIPVEVVEVEQIGDGVVAFKVLVRTAR